jgi:HSP20 family protein
LFSSIASQLLDSIAIISHLDKIDIKKKIKDYKILFTRFDPFENLEKSFYTYPSTHEGVGGFVPIVNTREAESAFYIDLDLPGVKKEDIKVDMNKDILTISSERKIKEELKEDDYYKLETTFCKFSRSFTLPENIDLNILKQKVIMVYWK